MPRIRTIKPQFWTDEKIGQLPLGARLLFIGTWNLADDEGILFWNAAYLKGQLFPYDIRVTNHNIKKWMDNIASLNLVAVYEDALQEKHVVIRGWHKHQSINRPQPTQHPDILDTYNKSNSLNNQGTFTANSLTEKEKEKEKEKESSSALNKNTETVFSVVANIAFKAFARSLTQKEIAALEKDANDLGEALIEQGIKLSQAEKDPSKHNLNYALGIARRLKESVLNGKQAADDTEDDVDKLYPLLN